jgi:hypothetical protein
MQFVEILADGQVQNAGVGQNLERLAREYVVASRKTCERGYFVCTRDEAGGAGGDGCGDGKGAIAGL